MEITKSFSVEIYRKIVGYSMENQQSNFKIMSKNQSVSKLTDRHIKVALMFKSNVQAETFNIITMLTDAIPKDAKDKDERQILR